MRILRIALPGVIAAILFALVAWIAIRGALSHFADAQRPGAARIHMTNAVFLGREESGRPFRLVAALAERDDGQPDRVFLTRPALRLDTDADSGISGAAERGVFIESRRQVTLDGGVRLDVGGGDVFTTDLAVVDTGSGVITGPHPVTGSGPRGRIAARSFVVLDRGARAVFSGEVHSRMNPD